MAVRSCPRGKTSPTNPNRTTTPVARRSLHDDVTAALRTLGIALTPTALDAALGLAGGSGGFDGSRKDVHESTAELLKKLIAATP